MSVLERLHEKENLTRSEAELADFILKNADATVSMGISDLAKAAGKSNSTIIRLCRKVGSTGWREFKLDLVASVERARRNMRDIDPNKPFEGEASTASVMRSISVLQCEAIKDCYSQVDPAAIGTFARAAVQARRIIYYGRGDSYATLYSFGALMAKIGVECIAADQYRFRREASFHANHNDIALIASYSGWLFPDIEPQIANLRANRCKICAITADRSQLNTFPRFDYPILLPMRENRFNKVGTFYAQTCIRYVLNCVYSVAFSKNYDANITLKDYIEEFDVSML